MGNPFEWGSVAVGAAFVDFLIVIGENVVNVVTRSIFTDLPLYQTRYVGD